MSKVIINCYEDFQKYLGTEIGVSDYLVVDQQRINLFADATRGYTSMRSDAARKAPSDRP